MSELKADETGTAIVPVLACVLNQLCRRNDRLPMPANNVSKFHALRAPAIGIEDYLARIAKYAACSGECFVLALVYIDRIIQSNPTFVVNSLNIHRLLITSIMLAAKFFDDQYYNNAYYAKVGGVPAAEINTLEVEFLFMCDFSLAVTSDVYTQYYTELCNHASNLQSTCACSQGPKIPNLTIPFLHSIPHCIDYPYTNQSTIASVPNEMDDIDPVHSTPVHSRSHSSHYSTHSVHSTHPSHSSHSVHPSQSSHHYPPTTYQQQPAAQPYRQQQQAGIAIPGNYAHHSSNSSGDMSTSPPVYAR